MEQVERIIKLHGFLTNARYPVSRKKLEEKLECSSKTVRRDLELLRDRFGAPVEYDKELNGWQYKSAQRGLYELPGLWLNEQEIFALLTIQQLLSSLDPEFLQQQIEPFEERIRQILKQTTALEKGEEIGQFIRLVTYGKRDRQYNFFQRIASATFQKKQLRIIYHARGKNKKSERVISPLQLVHYRDNWFLCAWCHFREAIRIFSMDKIEDCHILEQSTKKMSKNKIDEYLSASFGIFTGEAENLAILEFDEENARWVADESWHPEQVGKWLKNNRYRLEIPYSNATELIGEILRYGAGVTVKSPDSLKDKIKTSLETALQNYTSTPSNLR
jgi:predicted DNA-binding transcriptional regulator YafY